MANRIKELRKSKNMTLKQLSAKTGISVSSLSAYEKNEGEKGYRSPKIDKWVQLADFFDVPVPYLQGVSDDKNTFTYKDFKEASANTNRIKNGRVIKVNNLEFSIADEKAVKEYFDEKVYPEVLSDMRIRLFVQLYVQLKARSDFRNSYERLVDLLNGIVLYSSGNYKRSIVYQNLDQFIEAFDRDNNKSNND